MSRLFKLRWAIRNKKYKSAILNEHEANSIMIGTGSGVKWSERRWIRCSGHMVYRMSIS